MPVLAWPELPAFLRQSALGCQRHQEAPHPQPRPQAQKPYSGQLPMPVPASGSGGTAGHTGNLRMSCLALSQAGNKSPQGVFLGSDATETSGVEAQAHLRVTASQ